MPIKLPPTRVNPALRCTAIAALLLVAVPAHAKLLVVSAGDPAVLEYDAGTGAFNQALVEPVTAGFAFPGGVAVRPTDGMLYVASTGSGEIFAYDTSTGLVTLPAVATGLQAPGELAFEPSGGELYFLADIPNGPNSDAAVRRLTISNGNVTTLASDANASFSAIALQGSHIYVSDSFGGTVLRFPIGGGSGTVVVSGLVSPAGILFRSATEMLVADSGADSVDEYHDLGGTWTFDRQVLGPASGVDSPTGLGLAPDGRLSVSGSISNDIAAVDLTTLAVSTLVASSGGLAVPGQLAWDAGTLFVASRSNNLIRYFDTSGNPTGVVARGLTAPPDSGIAATPDGGFLVASTGANSVSKFDGATGQVVAAYPNACPLSFTAPFDVAEDAGGHIYVSCAPTDGVRVFDSIGVSVPFVTAGAGGLASPRGIAFGPNGNLFVSSLTGEVLEYDGSTGAFIGVFVDATGNAGGAVDPYGLHFHQGDLYVVSNFPNEVKRYDATTGAFISTFVSSGSGGLSNPRGLGFGPSGDLYVTSASDHTVKRYDATTGAFVSNFVSAASGGLDQPSDLAFVSAPSPPSVPGMSGPGGVVLVLLMASTARAATRRSEPISRRILRG